MLASTPSQHLESDYRPRRNPKCESTSKNHALVKTRWGQPPRDIPSCRSHGRDGATITRAVRLRPGDLESSIGKSHAALHATTTEAALSSAGRPLIGPQVSPDAATGFNPGAWEGGDGRMIAGHRRVSPVFCHPAPSQMRMARALTCVLISLGVLVHCLGAHRRHG
jgi:hypothetical protein